LREAYGGRAYSMDNNTEARPANENPEEAQSGMNGPTFNSNTSWEPKANRFRGTGGKFTSNAEGQRALSNDALFVFFNKNAYMAGWTKEVLQSLKGITGTTDNSGLKTCG